MGCNGSIPNTKKPAGKYKPMMNGLGPPKPSYNAPAAAGVKASTTNNTSII
jgi:hypothetical protein